MGTSFFKAKPNGATPKSYNLEARSLGAPAYAGRTDAVAAQKALGTAIGLDKGAQAKPLTGTSAHPKGPKV